MNKEKQSFYNPLDIISLLTYSPKIKSEQREIIVDYKQMMSKLKEFAFFNKLPSFSEGNIYKDNIGKGYFDNKEDKEFSNKRDIIQKKEDYIKVDRVEYNKNDMESLSKIILQKCKYIKGKHKEKKTI